MLRLRVGLGQLPPGRVEMSSSSPLRSKEECRSFDGELFDSDRICCSKVASPEGGYYLCRSTTFGAAAPPTGPSFFPGTPTPSPSYAPPPSYPAPGIQSPFSAPVTIALIGGGVLLAALALHKKGIV